MGSCGTLGHLQGLCNRLRYQFLLGEGSKLNKPHPVGVGLDEVAGHLKGEARLARASRSREGQEPRRGQLLLYLEHILLTTHEAAPLRGQVVLVDDLRIVCSTGAHNIWLLGDARPTIPQEPQEVRHPCTLTSRGGCLSHAGHDAPQEGIAHPPNG